MSLAIAVVLLSTYVLSLVFSLVGHKDRCGSSPRSAGDGECNWLEGVQLLSVYLIIAILFYFLPEAPHAQP